MKTDGRTWFSLVAFVSIGVGCVAHADMDNSSRTLRATEATRVDAEPEPLAGLSTSGRSTVRARAASDATPSRQLNKPRNERVSTGPRSTPRVEGSSSSVAAAATGEPLDPLPSVPPAVSTLDGDSIVPIAPSKPPPARVRTVAAPRTQAVKLTPPATHVQAVCPPTIVRRTTRRRELTAEFTRFRRVGEYGSTNDLGLGPQDTCRYDPIPTDLFPIRQPRSVLGNFLDQVVEGSVVGMRTCP